MTHFILYISDLIQVWQTSGKNSDEIDQVLEVENVLRNSEFHKKHVYRKVLKKDYSFPWPKAKQIMWNFSTFSYITKLHYCRK